MDRHHHVSGYPGFRHPVPQDKNGHGPQQHGRLVQERQRHQGCRPGRLRQFELPGHGNHKRGQRIEFLSHFPHQHRRAQAHQRPSYDIQRVMGADKDS